MAHTKNSYSTFLLFVMVMAVLMLSLWIGPSTGVAYRDIYFYFFYPESLTEEQMMMISSVLLHVRLPRILLAFMVGAALAVSGTSLQAVFRNPLVCPYVTGISAGSAFGAALSIATGFLNIQLSAFLFGLSAVALSYIIAGTQKQVSTVSLVLSGVVMSGIFTALLTVVQFLSDPFRLQSIVLWTMGNLHNANWDKVQSSLVPIVSALFVLWLFRWKFNVIALGEDEARAVGMNPHLWKWILVGASAVATSAAVSVAGIIGLYGLFVPHILRMIFGADNRKLVALNLLAGGGLLVIIDDFSRSLVSFEIPIGVLTMLLGAPFFMFILKKFRIGWES